MYKFYDLDSRALVSNDMTLVHDFVLYVTGYEKDIYSWSGLSGSCRLCPSGKSGRSAQAVFKASVESEQTKLGAGVNEDAGVVSFFWTKSDAVAVNTSDGLCLLP